MSHAAKVLQVMQFDREYDAATVSVMARIPEPSAQDVLHQLAKGGVIEQTVTDRYRKNRKYKTKQRNLFI